MNHKLKIESISFILILFLGVNTFSQDVEFNRLDSPDGGAFGFITGITQGADGNIWISSKGGLLKYNGTRLVNYQFNPLNSGSISTNNLEYVFADEDGSIWIGTLGSGLDKLDPKTGVFKHFQHDPDNPKSISNDTVTTILRDSRGDLYIGTHQGLERFDEATGEFVHFRHDARNLESISNNQVRVLYEDKHGALWVGTGSPYADNGGGPEDGGLNRFDRVSGTFKRYQKDSEKKGSLTNNKISAIYEDSMGRFWVGTAFAGMHLMDREKGTFERVEYDPDHPENLGVFDIGSGIADYEHITFITEDAAGNFWYGTVENGIYNYNLKEGRIHKYRRNESQQNGFEGGGAWAAYTSREGIFWLGAVFPGNILRVNPNKISIEHHPTEAGVQGFYRATNGDFYIGLESGFNITKPNGEMLHRTLKNPASSGGNWVSDFKEDSKGRFWISGLNGLNRFDSSTNELIPYDLNPKEMKVPEGNRVTLIHFDNEDDFWAGTVNGLCKFDPETGEVSRMYLRRRDSANVGMNVISSLLEEGTRHFWVGVFNGGGLYLFDKDSGESIKYLGNMDLLDLYRDRSGMVWAGTSDGLYWYNEKQDEFLRFVNPLLNSGIPEVAGIAEDDDGNLWVTSIIGLVQINPKRDQVSIFDRNLGVNNYNFYWDSAFKDVNGDLYFGNEQGYFVITPDDLKKELKSPEISLTAFRLGDEFIIPGENSPLEEDLNSAEEISLSHDQNVFSFDFSTIDYTNPDGNRMIYYLENYDNNWKLANSENRAYYFNVPPGEYVFRLKGSKGYGPWVEKQVAIVIAPPWWLTWWAYAIYVVLFGLAIFAFDRFMRQRLIRIERERSRERELKQAKEIEKAYTELKNTQAQLIQSEKMASLGELTAGIAHEIQNPLNFVNNFSEVNSELIEEMKEEVKKGNMEEVMALADDIDANEQKIMYHGKRADSIVKGMLQHSRVSNGIKEATDINTLADEYLRLAYHGLRAKDKTFNAQMKTDFQEGIGTVNVISQDIGRVLLNLITNAFFAVDQKKKAGEENYEPMVLVSTEERAKQVEIKVTDNGSGIPSELLDKIFQPFFTTKPSGKGTGLGLSLSYDIVKAHGGEIKVESRQDEGTTFTVILPKS